MSERASERAGYHWCYCCVRRVAGRSIVDRWYVIPDPYLDPSIPVSHACSYRREIMSLKMK